MKRARQRARSIIGRNQVGTKLKAVIRQLKLFLPGCGNCFRTGNAHGKFRQCDRYVASRLRRLLIKKPDRNLRAGQAGRWTETWFHDQALHNSSDGTMRLPEDGVTMSGRPSMSRMRVNRTNQLKGG